MKEDRQWLYSLVVENSLTGIFIVQDGKIVFCNQRFADMFGYDCEELIGKDSLDLVPYQDRIAVAALREKRLKGTVLPSEYEIRGIRKDGQIIWTIRRNTLIDYNGKPAILGNSLEISERKNVESRLKKSEKILRFLSAQLLQAHENERKRIARELHDTIAQNLAGIKFYLSHKIQSIGSERYLSQQALQPAVEMADRSIREVRRIITDLRPPCIDDLGILATINWHCRQFKKKYPEISIVQEFDVDENDVPDPLKLIIYRVLQESLNNVAKHSGANKVKMLIKKDKNRLIFMVEDNGTGFDIMHALSPMQPETGWGIIGMKERTELSGGFFSIKSSVEKGTRVLISWEC
ncbi:MAG: PAS domain-containing sensor histidine kinase [Desulfobacterales bacterium]|nr:PAS domain-containing sensor histidine kinase [Desulfobacterales bacterium]